MNRNKSFKSPFFKFLEMPIFQSLDDIWIHSAILIYKKFNINKISLKRLSRLASKIKWKVISIKSVAQLTIQFFNISLNAKFTLSVSNALLPKWISLIKMCWTFIRRLKVSGDGTFFVSRWVFFRLLRTKFYACDKLLFFFEYLILSVYTKSKNRT